MAAIYKITNTVNGKIYIGQTSNSIQARFRKHKGQINCKNQCTALCAAFRKYGVENFKIEPIISGKISKSELNDLELYFIQEYNSLSPNGYNLQTGGGSFLLSDEVKKKISETMKGRNITWGDKISKGLTKMWKSKEYRDHMSEVHKGKRGKYKKHDKPLRLQLPILEIKEQYKNGVSIYKLAKIYKVSYGAIKRRVNK